MFGPMLREAAGADATGTLRLRRQLDHRHLRDLYARARFVVVPLRDVDFDAGVTTITEAMAMGKAVVSTAIGAEGLPVRDGEHLLLADQPVAFASAVVRVLRDPDSRRRLESAARALVVEQYDWSAVAHDLDRALTRIAQGSPTPVGVPRDALSEPRSFRPGVS